MKQSDPTWPVLMEKETDGDLNSRLPSQGERIRSLEDNSGREETMSSGGVNASQMTQGTVKVALAGGANLEKC